MKVVKILANIFFVLCLAAAGLFFLAHFTEILPLRIFIVSSGSMEPAVKTGSLVIVFPSPLYKVGDIVTYKTGKKDTTTHRLVAASGGQYKTAGDANNTPDPALITSDSILGRVVSVTPYLGYIAGFAKTPPGFILFVIVPATIIVYEELKSLFSTIKRVPLPKNTPLFQFPSPKLGEGSKVEYPIKPVFIIIPIFFAAFILATVKSISYFSDTETSSQNSFTAFITTPTPTIPLPTSSPSPTPTPHPVINEVASAVNPNDEWVEIFNPNSSPLDISGWKIQDNTETDIIPTVTPIPANGYAVIMGSNGNTSLIPITAITIVLSDTKVGNNLGNDGDRVILKTPTDTVIDQMSYGTDTLIFPTPPAAPSSTQSLARSPNGTDTDTAGDWVVDTSPSIGVSN